jgi:hypothetical protein
MISNEQFDAMAEDFAKAEASAQKYIDSFYGDPDVYDLAHGVLQEIAYSTYLYNVQVSRDLDAIFASCPGYLDRSRRA